VPLSVAVRLFSVLVCLVSPPPHPEIHPQKNRTEVARQQRHAAQERAQRESRQGQTGARQQPLSAEAPERQIARSQQCLLTGRRVRVEVGYVELLHGEAATPEERTRLIAESEARQRQTSCDRPGRTPTADLPDPEEVAEALEDHVTAAMDAQAASIETPEAGRDRVRPRRQRATTRANEADAPDEGRVAL